MAKDAAVIGTQSGALRALDARDGTQLWKHDLGHPFDGPALAQAGDTIFAASLDGSVFALQARDGTLRWQQQLPGVTTSLVSGNQLRVVASSVCVVVQHGKRILALDPTEGRALWEYASAPESRYVYLVAKGAAHAYVVEGQYIRPPISEGLTAEERFRAEHRGVPVTWILSALSAQDDTLRWRSAEYGPVEPVWDGGSSLVEAEGIVYAYGHGLHALDAATGGLRWTQKDIPAFHVGDVAVGRAELAVALGGYLGAFRKDTGARLWSELGRRGEGAYFEEFASIQMFDDEVTLVVARIGYNPQGVQIEARETDTGALRWKWPGEHMDLQDPRISWRFGTAGSTLCVPVGGMLLGLHASDGHQLWQAALSGTSYALLGVTADGT